MDTSLELKKYHIMEYLMNISDLKLLDKVEKIISENNEEALKEEMIKRTSISEQQLTEENFKTHDQAIERFSKWIK